MSGNEKETHSCDVWCRVSRENSCFYIATKCFFTTRSFQSNLRHGWHHSGCCRTSLGQFTVTNHHLCKHNSNRSEPIICCLRSWRKESNDWGRSRLSVERSETIGWIKGAEYPVCCGIWVEFISAHWCLTSRFQKSVTIFLNWTVAEPLNIRSIANNIQSSVGIQNLLKSSIWTSCAAWQCRWRAQTISNILISEKS